MSASAILVKSSLAALLEMRISHILKLIGEEVSHQEPLTSDRVQESHSIWKILVVPLK